MNNLESMVEFLRQSGASEELIESFKERFETPQVTQEESTDAPQPTTEVEEPSVETTVENEQVIEEINEIQELEDKLQDLTASYYANEMSSEEFTKEKDKLESQIAQAKKTEVDKMIAKNIEARVKELEDQLQDLTASYYANEMSSEEFTRRKDELEALIAEAKNSNNNTKVVEEINSRVKELEDELQDLTAAYYGNEMSSEEFTERKNKLEALIAEAKNSGVNERVNEEPQVEETNEKSEEVETAAPEVETKVEEENKTEEETKTSEEPSVEADSNTKENDSEEEIKSQPIVSEYTSNGPKMVNLFSNRISSENKMARKKIKRKRNATIAMVAGIEVALSGTAFLAGLALGPVGAAGVYLAGAAGGLGIQAINSLAQSVAINARTMRVNNLANKLNARLYFDHGNSKVVFGKKELENGKPVIFNSFDEVKENLKESIKKENPDITEEEINILVDQKAEEVQKQFKFMFSNGLMRYNKFMEDNNLENLINSGNLDHIYNQYGGFAIKPENLKVDGTDVRWNKVKEITKKSMEDKKTKLEGIIARKEELNIPSRVVDITNESIEDLKKAIERKTNGIGGKLKSFIGSKAGDLGITAKSIYDRVSKATKEKLDSAADYILDEPYSELNDLGVEQNNVEPEVTTNNYEANKSQVNMFDTEPAYNFDSFMEQINQANTEDALDFWGKNIQVSSDISEEERETLLQAIQDKMNLSQEQEQGRTR